MHFSAVVLAILVQFSIGVFSQAPNPINFPSEGTSVNAGETVTITWTPTSDTGIWLYLKQGDQFGLNCIVQNLAAGIPNTGNFLWTIPATLPSSDNYYLRIQTNGLDALMRTCLLAGESDDCNLGDLFTINSQIPNNGQICPPPVGLPSIPPITPPVNPVNTVVPIPPVLNPPVGNNMTNQSSTTPIVTPTPKNNFTAATTSVSPTPTLLPIFHSSGNGIQFSDYAHLIIATIACIVIAQFIMI